MRCMVSLYLLYIGLVLADDRQQLHLNQSVYVLDVHCQPASRMCEFRVFAADAGRQKDVSYRQQQARSPRS